MYSKTQPLHVCQVMVPGPLGGAEKVVLMGAEALIKRGIQVELCIIKETRYPEYAAVFGQLARQKNIPTCELEIRQRFDFKFFRAFSDYLKANAFSVLHTHGYKALIYTFFARKNHQKLVATHHGVTSHDWVILVYETLERIFLKRCDHVVVVSDQMYAVFKKRRFAPEKLSLVANMVSLQPSRSSQLVYRSDRLRLIFLGRLSVEKGVTILLQALADPQIISKVTVDILGSGQEQQQLEEECRQLQLEKYVFFHGFQANIEPFLDRSDVLVVPSYREGLPMTVLEAAAFAKPIIASDVGGISAIVKTGKTGILVPPGDVDQLRRAIVTMLESFDEFKENAVRHAPSIIEQYSPLAWADKTHQIYRG